MELEDLAKRIRNACLEAVRQAYEDAGVQGLCAEGRWEAAIGPAADTRSHAGVA
jgi:hypothetical protein